VLLSALRERRAASAAHARLHLIPRLDDHTLPRLAWHIRAITAVAVSLATVGD
jgi:hypothetical protein